MKLLFLLLAATAAFGQTTVNVTVTIKKEWTASVNQWLFNQFSGSTTLTAAIGANDTTMTLAANVCAAVPCMVRIDNEAINITARTGASVTAMTRGVSSTAKASHAINATAQKLKYESADDLVKSAVLGRMKELRDLIFSAYPPSNVQGSSDTIAAEQVKVQAEKEAAVTVQ